MPNDIIDCAESNEMTHSDVLPNQSQNTYKYSGFKQFCHVVSFHRIGVRIVQVSHPRASTNLQHTSTATKRGTPTANITVHAAMEMFDVVGLGFAIGNGS